MQLPAPVLHACMATVFPLYNPADGPSSQSGMQSRSARQVEPLANSVCWEITVAGSLPSHVCAMQQACCSAARLGGRNAPGQVAPSHHALLNVSYGRL